MVSVSLVSRFSNDGLVTFQNLRNAVMMRVSRLHAERESVRVVEEDECIHGVQPSACADCGGRTAGSSIRTDRSRTGFEKLLVYCPQITTETLLHFNRQGDSYRLRSFVGELSNRAPWMQPDAPTSADFLRRYLPERVVDVGSEGVRLTETARWSSIVTEHNRRLGIGL